MAVVSLYVSCPPGVLLPVLWLYLTIVLAFLLPVCAPPLAALLCRRFGPLGWVLRLLRACVCTSPSRPPSTSSLVGRVPSLPGGAPRASPPVRCTG